MLRLFRRKNTPQPDDIVHELWEPRFTRPKTGRFVPLREEAYHAEYLGRELMLTLEKQQLFAWVNNPLYRYRDFVLEGQLRSDSGNGNSASGFLFRYVNEENYYYFLVSNRGFFRFDLVFNGNPMSLIPWTEFPGSPEKSLPVRIIARGSMFYFFADDTWIGEIENEGIDAGGIAFAGQNYDEHDRAVFALPSLRIESRPVEVERQFFRWTRFIQADPDQRSRLATSFYRQGQFTASIVQLKKISRERPLNRDEYLMLGDGCINLDLPNEALAALENVLQQDNGSEEAAIGKANALYTLNRFVELKDFLLQTEDLLSKSSVLQNLLGNAEYSLGNFSSAAEAYLQALSLEDDMPLFQLNAARALERTGDEEQALDLYIRAAKALYSQEAFEDLPGVLAYILSRQPENQEIMALKGKMLFQEEQFAEAQILFQQLIAEGCDDSAVHYLAGLMEIRNGQRVQGYQHFKRAAELEDSFPLYWRKVAETEMLLSLPAEESIKKTLELSPEDPWALNLAGQHYIEAGDAEKALSYLEKARGLKPEEIDILLNYVEALSISGKLEEAAAVLKQEEGRPEVYNQLGNVYASMGRYEESLGYYEKAVADEKDNPLYQENCAAVCLELDLLNRAEELLVTLLDTAPTARVYNLLANTAWIKGEHARAEEIFKQGREQYPSQPDLSLNYGELLLQRGMYEEAVRIADEVLSWGPHDRAETLKDRVLEKTETVLQCASCDRTWRVKKDIPAQGTLRLVGDPPDEAPAGTCPSCGNMYCVGCAKNHLVENRFTCPECSESLKLSDDYVKYLLKSYIS